MPMSANEVSTLAPAPASAENLGELSQVSRRTDAVGAEIAVTIHASRYSAATKGTASKHLPAIHEETRTVIIFPGGAVVRLSASVTTGELVVLTNQQTGDDVICRVANVKAQPGTQNYVNLEFTQRAPSFWGDAMPAETVARSSPSVLPHPMPAVLPQAAVPTLREGPASAGAPASISAAVAARATTPEKLDARIDTATEARLAPARSPVLVPASELISAVQAITNLLNVAPTKVAPTDIVPTEVVATPVRNQPLSEKQSEAAQNASVRMISEPSGQVVFGALRPITDSALTLTAESKPQVSAAEAPALIATSPLSGVHAMLPRTANTGAANAESAGVAGLKLNTAIAPDLKAVPRRDPAGIAEITIVKVNAGSNSAGPAIPVMPALPGPLAQAAAPDRVQPAEAPVRTIGAMTAAGDEKQPKSKNIAMIAAAAVVLLIVGGAGGAVLFRQSRPVATQPAATSATALPATAAPAVNSPAAVAPPLAATAANIVPESAPSRSEANSQPKTSAAAESSARRQSIAVGRIAAPISKGARALVSSEPPPELVAPISTLPDSSMLNTTRSDGPAVPGPVPPSTSAHLGGQLKQPKLLESTPASYPPMAQRQKLQGSVVIDVLVDASGKVAEMKVISGLADLRQAALDSVRNWRYEPAQLNGQAIALRTRVTVDFHLH